VLLKRSPVEYAGPSDLVRIDFEADGLPSSEELIEPSLRQLYGYSKWPTPNVTGITPQRELIEIDFETNARTILRENVASYQRHWEAELFSVTSDGELGELVTEYATWTLWHRTLGELGTCENARAWSRLQGYVIWVRDPQTEEVLSSEIRLASRPQSVVVLAGDWDLQGESVDGVGVATTSRSHEGGPAIAALDPGSDLPLIIHLASNTFGWGWVEGDAYYFFEFIGGAVGDYPTPTQDDRYHFVRVFLDGSGFEVLSPDVNQPIILPDNQFLTVRGYAGDYLGKLVLADLGGDVTLDQDVFIFFARLQGEGPAAWSGFEHPPLDHDEILYTVYAPGRNGLWSLALLK
jgi:hypothetical protein